MSNEHNGYDKSDWKNELSSEIDFWNWAFTETFEKNNDVFHLEEDAGKPFVNRDVAPNVGIFLKNKDTEILDVGSGPVTAVGDCFNGQVMPNVMMTDPLADTYNSLLDKYNVKTHYRPIKVDFCDEVEVKRVLQGKTFDMVHSRNALDHSYAPDKAIRNMLLCLKEQGLCNIRMVINEGTSAKFHGLHKWDFGITSEHGVTITNQGKSVVISIQDIINGLGSSDKFKVCYVFSTDFVWKQEIKTSSWLHFAIFKNYDDNEIDKYYNKMQKLALEETEKFREKAQKRLWETRDKMRKAQARLNELGEKIPE